MMILIGLTAALSGPLLRQAEAAGDYARALATLLDPEDTILTPDGGVGDDMGETTLRAGGSPESVSHWSPCCNRLAEIDGLAPSTTPIHIRPDLGSSQRRRMRATWLPVGANQRHAWLQLLVI
jgi:hypothetical protein